MRKCPCPSPPGGFVSCRDDQLAVCRVRGGEVESECIDLSPRVVAFLFTKAGRAELKHLHTSDQVDAEIVQLFWRIVGAYAGAPSVYREFVGTLLETSVGASFEFEWPEEGIRVAITPPEFQAVDTNTGFNAL